MLTTVYRRGNLALGARLLCGVLVMASGVACSSAGESGPVPDDAAANAVVVDAVPLGGTGPTGGPLLAVLDPAATGLDFRNELPLEYEGQFLLVGAGVAAGDFDGDGRPDIFLVGQTQPSRLFKNAGDWRFVDVTDEAGIFIDLAVNTGLGHDRFPTGAGFVDVDGDGDLDLYVTAFAGPSVLFRNNGDGTFTDVTDASGAGYMGAASTAAFADYDRDGDMDMFVATYRPMDKDRITAVHGQLVGEPDVLFTNRGDGTFDRAVGSGASDGAYRALAATFADANGDGWPDLFVANHIVVSSLSPLFSSGATAPQLYINQRDGTFAAQTLEGTDHVPAGGVDIGDINNDGRMDLMVASGLVSAARNRLYENLGGATYTEIAHFAGVAGAPWPTSAKIVDLDLDGWNDLLGTEWWPPTYAAGYGEGKTKMAFKNGGDGTFHDTSMEWGWADDVAGDGMALADFDGDGDLDVVVNQMTGPAVLYRNDAAAPRLKVALRGKTSNAYGVGARITLEGEWGVQIREMSTSGGYFASHEPVVVFGMGAVSVAERLVVDWPSGHRSELRDVAANQALVVHEPAGTAKFPPPPPASEPQFLEVGDQMRRFSPQGSVGPSAGGAEGAGLAVERAQRALDLLTTPRGAPLTSHPGLAELGPIAVADYDSDGDLDVFVGGSQVPAGSRVAGASHFFINENGVLAQIEMPALANLGVVSEALWTDVDGDGDVDLVASTEWGPVRILSNDGGQLVDATEEAGLLRHTGVWTAVDAGDVDGDGDVDLVVANLGLNTPHRARVDAPLARAGEPPAEVTRLEHTLFVNDGRGRFEARALPPEAQKVTGYGIALVDMDADGHDDIVMVGDHAFRDAEPGRELSRSAGGVPTGGSVAGVYLRGDGRGGFTAVPPDRSGVRVPYNPRGLVVADFDGDAWADIVVGLVDGATMLFRNGGAVENSGLVVALDGPVGNPMGVGARVSVTAGGAKQMREVRAGGRFYSPSRLSVHFGLGTARDRPIIRVTWPDGRTQQTIGTPGAVNNVTYEEGR